MDVSNQEYISSPDDTISSLEYSSDELFIPQGGFEMMVGADTRTPNTTFSDFSPGYTTMLGDTTDDTYNVAHEESLNLKEFFARPVKIVSYNWSVNAAFLQSFNPWELFIEQARVSNRISNYKMLRGRLHVRFILNGNPFYYGLLIASYLPLSVSDDFAGSSTQIIQRSQNPHVYLDPTTSTGGDMILPFFWEYNAFDLPAGDHTSAGTITISDVSQLRHANGGNDGITLSVFAWMEEVTLSGITNHNISGLIPQGGDEYGSTPISDIAASVGRAAGMITAPAIQPYARATMLAASTIAQLAKMFGYSKPNTVNPIMPMRMMTGGNLANSNIGDMTTKLTLDCKQETTIDPRTVGLAPVDEMALVPLAQRESYLFKTSWNAANPPGKMLASIAVTPSLYDVMPDNGIVMTPACWVAQPFQYWRGSMMVRIKIVASSFHKGRLRVLYDPTYAESNSSFNLVQNHIVDIAECKDFCFRVGWNSPQSYLRVATLNTDKPFRIVDELPLTPSGIATNGTIIIEVLNELTTPGSVGGASAQIDVLVFTSMCEDFEVQAPNSAMTDYTFFPTPPPGLLSMVPEGGTVALDENAGMSNAPCMDTAECTVAPPLSPSDNTPGIYFGESITSWRQCLKRYNFTDASVSGVTTSQYHLYRMRRNNIPLYRGYAPNAQHLTATNVPYNYTKMTLLNWVLPAYAAMRGGLRYKYMLVNGTAATSNTCCLHITRAGGIPYEDLTVLATAWGGLNSSSDASALTRPLWAHTWVGAMNQLGLNTPCVEAEIPYQDNRRFWRARYADYTNGARCNGHTTTFYGTSAAACFHTYVGAGEDFSLFFFLNTPTVYVEPNDPAVA